MDGKSLHTPLLPCMHISSFERTEHLCAHNAIFAVHCAHVIRLIYIGDMICNQISKWQQENSQGSDAGLLLRFLKLTHVPKANCTIRGGR